MYFGLILAHEYGTRIRSRAFWLISLMMPLAMACVIFLPAWIMSLGGSDKLVIVCDESGLYADSLLAKSSQSECSYIQSSEPFERLCATYDWDEGEAYAVLHIDGDLSRDGRATLLSDRQVDVGTQRIVESDLSALLQRQLLSAYRAEELESILRDSRAHVGVLTQRVSEAGAHGGRSQMAMIMSVLMSGLIYMFIFLYGNQIMNSVMEERQTRVVETIVSCVRPFDLMAGKVAAIGLIGLTQIVIWVVSGAALVGVASMAVPLQGDGIGSDVLGYVSSSNFGSMVLSFALFFVGGYWLYAILFAAIGSLADNPSDAQQFTLPISLLMLFAFYAAFYAGSNPDGAISVWCSMIPFTSPVVMMARMAYGVEAWRVALSLVLLIITGVGATWIAGVIYRNNILSFGQKSSWRSLAAQLGLGKRR